MEGHFLEPSSTEHFHRYQKQLSLHLITKQFDVPVFRIKMSAQQLAKTSKWSMHEPWGQTTRKQARMLWNIPCTGINPHTWNLQRLITTMHQAWCILVCHCPPPPYPLAIYINNLKQLERTTQVSWKQCSPQAFRDSPHTVKHQKLHSDDSKILGEG